jgi:hypothetical protein
LNLGRIHKNGGAEEFVVQFAVEIWSQAGNSMDSNAQFEEKVNLTVTLVYYNLHQLFFDESRQSK